MLDISFKLKQTPFEIYKMMQRELIPQLNSKFGASIPQMKKRIKSILEKHVRMQPEWNSIVSGELRTNLGLPDGLRRIENILFIWLDSVKVVFKPFRMRGPEYTGGIKISAIPAGYRDVLQFRDAKFITEKDQRLQWLKWLLLEGGSNIVLGYWLGFGRGRAGNRIMLKNKNRSWKIPHGFRGTADDNFITRAVEAAEIDIQKAIEEIINDL